jgi:hypothetical protein
MSPAMTLLDTLRSLARDRDSENVRGNERNAENEITPPSGPETGLTHQSAS